MVIPLATKGLTDMGYTVLFALFIAGPLVLLGVNLGRGAVDLAKAVQRGGSRARRVKMSWPARPRRVLPAIDQARSLSPLAALRRWRRRPRRTAPAALDRPARRPQTPAPAAPAGPYALPVTASPTGFRPAPASAFSAGPALTPRRERDPAAAA